MRLVKNIHFVNEENLYTVKSFEAYLQDEA